MKRTLDKLFRATFSTDRAVLTLLLLVFFAWGGAMFLAGQRSTGADGNGLQALAELRFDLLQQQRQVDALLNSNEQSVNALAARLAELQAASTRLDALGQRLVQMGQLNLDEFDFDQPAPLGGPLDQEMNVAASENALKEAIAVLGARLRRQASHLDALQYLMVNRQAEADMTPAGWPVRKGWISSRFGERNDPFTGERNQHEGVDFAGNRGTKVMSVAGGVVIWAARRSGYGNTVEIDHGNGYVTRYAHNDDILVNAGDHIMAGQEIATMGSTGRASAPHVHFEVLQNGRQVNPSGFVKHLR